MWLANALDKGAGAAHKWASLPNALPPLQLVVKDVDGCFVSDPIKVAQIHAKPWIKEWRCDLHEEFKAEVQAFKDLRHDYLDDAPTWAATVDLQPTAIRRACMTFPARTAIGLDNIFFSDIAFLPDPALVVLGNLLRQCISTLALPVQILMNPMALLGKKARR